MPLDSIKKRVIEFLKNNKMDYKDIDMETYVDLFLEEMGKGLQGVESSLQMLPTYIDIENEIPLDEPVIVLDAGGTNFRVASIYFGRDKKPVIEKYKKYTMPGLKREVSKEDFFKIIAGYTQDVVGVSANIGFCFSYPTEMLRNKDGRLIHLSKEIQAKEVIGELIGDNLVSAIRSMGYSETKHVVLLNDTVATLLAGRSAFHDRVFDSYIGFILGTGTNCCYIEKNSNITKDKNLNIGREQIINIESGGFGKTPRGIIDLEFDKSMINPGMYTFEKMISGAYFGSLCLKTLLMAAEEGLISHPLKEEFEKISILDTEDVNDFLLYPGSKSNPLSSAISSGKEEDRITLYYIIDRLIERAAKLSAINLSSAVIESDKGKNPCYPVCITAEGSTFYGLKTLKEKVEYYLKSYLVERQEHYYEFVNVENATLIGAAIAGLTN